MKRVIKRWWNSASPYYQKTFNIPVDDIYYGPYCPTEKKLRLIGVDRIKNKKVLELGCGGGQCSIFLSKNGADCSGIDISKEQIQFAKGLAIKNNVNIDYFTGTGENLKMFQSGQFDFVLSVFSLQYISNLNKCFNEVERVLKRGGKFIFSLDHPFYSVINPKTMKIESIYNDAGLRETVKTDDIITLKEWRDGRTKKFVFYFRKVSDLYNSLVRSNFTVEKIIEPFSNKPSDPWYKIYSKKLSKNIPPTIIFVAKK